MSQPRDRSPSTREKPATRGAFSLEQAQRSLPLVRRILADAVAQYRLVEHIQKRRRALTRQQQPGQMETIERQGLEAAQRLSEFIDELKLIGCHVKDFEQGCVDFPSVRNGREICLCWTLREERIGYWHEKHGGFASRQPL